MVLRDREIVIGALEDAAQTIADVHAFDHHVGECEACARMGTGCPEGNRLYDQMVTADTGPKANVASALALLARGEHGDARTVEGAPDAEEQIRRLADYILANIPGEPSRNEGAVDCAIRLLDWCRDRLSVVALVREEPAPEMRKEAG